MNIKSLAVAVSALVLSTSVNAGVVTLDFDDSSLANQYFLDGELVTNTPVQVGTVGINGAADIINPPASYTSGPSNGSAYLHSSIYSSIFLQANGTDTFNLLSLELGEYSSYAAPATVNITGFINGGGQVSTHISMDGIFDGLGGVSDFQFATFGSNWSNLTRVEFDSNAYSLDNIQLDINSVPVPAAVWLFGSGILGLVGVARRKSV
jgi:hypothetical protein